MNYKRTFKLLDALYNEENLDSDVYYIISQIESKLREKKAMEEFKKLAKEYFTEEEIKEIIDGYNT